MESIKALDNRGIFKEEYGSLAGMSTKKGDPVVIKLLEEVSALIISKEYEHSYPHCWRHKTPLIFMSTPQWFISMKKSGLIEGAMNAVSQVTWEPEWGSQRILSMLEDRPDWCISRQRNWGVPIPLIIHSETGDIHPKQNILFNEIADVIEQEGIEGWDNLDLGTLIDDADQYIKVRDTLDVWFDSGVTHMCVLDKLYGADIKICPKNENFLEYYEKVIEDLKSKGTNVYFIPGGGSNPVGALGYVECLNEIIQENKKYNFSQILHATGSAGTQAGLLAGRKYFNCDIPVIGICVRHKKDIQVDKVYLEAKKTCEKLRCDILNKSDVIVHDEFIGSGYGEPTEEMKEATKLLARKEAILLDPVYSGKAFAGLIGLIKNKKFTKDDNILFIHTGGAVSLSAYEWAF